MLSVSLNAGVHHAFDPNALTNFAGHSDGLAGNDDGPANVAANVIEPETAGGTQSVCFAPAHGGQSAPATKTPTRDTAANAELPATAPTSAATDRSTPTNTPRNQIPGSVSTRSRITEDPSARASQTTLQLYSGLSTSNAADPHHPTCRDPRPERHVRPNQTGHTPTLRGQPARERVLRLPPRVQRRHDTHDVDSAIVKTAEGLG